mgnify:CR=1 FL=1
MGAFLIPSFHISNKVATEGKRLRKIQVVLPSVDGSATYAVTFANFGCSESDFISHFFILN